MSAPAPRKPKTYTVIGVWPDGSLVKIDSGLSPERAETIKVAKEGAFHDILLVEEQQPFQSADLPDPD